MTYPLLKLETEESEIFIEGVILAANLATKPLDPELWLSEVLPNHTPNTKAEVEQHIHKQYAYLKRNEYSLLSLLDAYQKDEQLADFAEGFMTMWPKVELQWQEVNLVDGSLRMLQALLTTLMLAIDESKTQAEMKAAGVDSPPSLNDLAPQLDLMINEVALAADEIMLGAKAQSLNPFKGVGRNDQCPCGSGKKFKQCCGQ
ncbi:prepilin peptidase [Vibrio sp. OCN044]|uniref:Prepilin peptidase n=1 Tax=Vibrio tetraodonis subsp. pristinus TaxID=2695891 RepID=A0A6L8LXS1_9VIBR|nr:YecA family protein [Vibrio tetraodonis]MYM59896.1 prepilin peptidase [Vibrio tetraodonis subsp. pristinus]